LVYVDIPFISIGWSLDLSGSASQALHQCIAGGLRRRPPTPATGPQAIGSYIALAYIDGHPGCFGYINGVVP